MWSVTLLSIFTLIVQVLRHATSIRSHAWDLLPWIVAATLINLLPLPTRYSAHLVVDLPIEVAAALILQPSEAGLVGFISAVDTRELLRKITPTKAIFNKCNLAMGYFLTSYLAHLIDPAPSTSPWLLAIAALVLAVAFVVNLLLVSIVIWLEGADPIGRVIKRLPLGTFQDFAWTFVGWVALGGMLAALYDRVHPWALLAFILPTVLTRQMLLRSQAYVDTSQAYRSRDSAIRELARRVREERSDERRLIAADLHDQVLQPLFKVSLVAQVLKADLAKGKLLELDQDLPELLTASELASSTLRELIGDLRQSALGRGGLAPALSRFLETTRRETSAHCAAELSEVNANADEELALYQIAREAIWNALKHAKASNLSVALSQRDGLIHLCVSDDGEGFDPLDDKPGHYGLHIMRERAKSIGADLLIDSKPGAGSRVTVLVKLAASG